MRVVQMNPSSAPHKESVRFSPPPPSAIPVREHKSALDFKAFKKDDWILLCIIAALILEGSDDYILICALGYLFIVGL